METSTGHSTTSLEPGDYIVWNDTRNIIEAFDTQGKRKNFPQEGESLACSSVLHFKRFAERAAKAANLRESLTRKYGFWCYQFNWPLPPN